MPTSYTAFKEEVKQWFVNNVSPKKVILDAGPGEGTYANLLNSLGYTIDAVEIWPPYIEKYNLDSKYRKVYVGDISRFDLSDYDFIILGDVLEHLPVNEAVRLIDKIKSAGKECLVAVPYLMPQDEHEGNKYETHHQSDLTPQVMSLRYPSLKLIYGNEHYGYYTNVSRKKHEKAYVLYATESYFDTVQGCVNSLKTVSKYPVYVYMINSDLQVDDAITVSLRVPIDTLPQREYIDRHDSRLYQMMILRPKIVADCLMNYAETVAYVDADSVATSLADTIFDMFPEQSEVPYFTEGIFDYLHIDGKGGAMSKDDMSTTLEHPACELFQVDQTVRERYRQTGYFVANQRCIPFINEWEQMCNHPIVLNNPLHYAPFHEETILNVLLWKKNFQEGLPLIYINGKLDRVNGTAVDDLWYKKPEHLLFYHGEKDLRDMNKMNEILNKKKLRILYLAPHLSTGGMPKFLEKRIECVKDYAEVFVVEYQNYSMDYTVQRNKIIGMVGPLNFMTLKYASKLDLFHYIDHFNPDIIHIDEMSERLDHDLMVELYNQKRRYRIIETCHDISFDPSTKIFVPDMLMFCTPYHITTFRGIPSYMNVVDYPINSQIPTYEDSVAAKLHLGFDPHKRHILNVGLWTRGKNQAEGLEIARKYPDLVFHFVGNQAVNFQEYWKPLMEDLPDNVVVWGERDDLDNFYKACDIFMFNSTWECNPIVLHEAISYGLPIVAHNLPQYEGRFDNYIKPMDTDLRSIATHYIIPKHNTDVVFGKRHLELYEMSMHNPMVRQIIETQTINIIQHFVDQPFIEITGQSDSNFLVQFFDEQNVCQHEDTIKINHWVKLNQRYFTKWTVKVYQDGNLIHENTLDYTGKRVLISFESESLGDTIAWIPYALEFKKKHNCEVVVGTFKNFLFKDVYPELIFVEPGTTVENLHGLYRIGWFYDANREPVLPHTVPLQQTASNILGLPYEEIVPRLNYTPRPRQNKFKYVAIATNSTAGCKFWIKEEWQKLVNQLKNKGYVVINVSKEKNHLDGVMQIKDTSLENTMHIIYHAEFFIGLSSGLSWLAWAMNKQVVMIANFTEANHEFQGNCIRITNSAVCHGCWNNPNFKFDKGDYNWCPIYKGTPKQFECQKSITVEMVIKKL